LSRVLGMPQLSANAPPAKKPDLNEKPLQQIGAQREPVASVTEQTTRTFEPVVSDRVTKR